ncbi:MAG: MBL fold metallo-hydrolase [Candidatus Altiarchaeota archaeon]|nr:MBL fold metallo-hydrolase [Candidatus Altiarchaeota archaeon]
MKITLVYDNEVYKEGLRADWGFSCLVEVENQPRILFDTGANGEILLGNMEKLDIEPETIDEIFISHSHWDHTGGLSDFLKVNNNVTIYSPASYQPPEAKKIVSIKEPLQIHENIFSTGELMGIEQSLVVKTGKGLVVIDGCSHPGVGNILQAALGFGKVYALIGGLHGFREFSLLEDLKLICPCHCTQHIRGIKRLYPDKYTEGGAGKVIEL